MGQLADNEVIIAGTTTPNDKSVEVIITALDITLGSGIAGTNGSITRTDAINDLLRANVKVGGGSSSIQETPDINNSSKDLGCKLMGDKGFDMETKNCHDGKSQFGYRQ